MVSDLQRSLRNAVENNLHGSYSEYREFFSSLSTQLNSIGLKSTLLGTYGLSCQSDQNKAEIYIEILEHKVKEETFRFPILTTYLNGEWKSQENFDFRLGADQNRAKIMNAIGYWVSNYASPEIIQNLLPEREPLKAPLIRLDI